MGPTEVQKGLDSEEDNCVPEAEEVGGLTDNGGEMVTEAVSDVKADTHADVQTQGGESYIQEEADTQPIVETQVDVIGDVKADTHADVQTQGGGAILSKSHDHRGERGLMADTLANVDKTQVDVIGDVNADAVSHQVPQP